VTLKRQLIDILDRQGGRHLLKLLASVKARQILGSNVEIGFDEGGWYHSLGAYRIPDGYRFDYYEPMIREWSSEIEQYFADVEQQWFKHYRPQSGDVILDVGAGRGEDTLPFSVAVGAIGHVYAIEAHPVSFDRLCRLCELNKLKNVTPISVAIMGKSGLARIGDDNSWESNTIMDEEGEIPAMTLDELCIRYNINRIDFLKMNIEGAERHAFDGMRETLPKLSEVCICAHDFRADRGHGEFYRTRTFVERILKDEGFEISRNESDDHDYARDHIFGWRKQLPRSINE
jgi:FkbM family methyltransferase